MPRKKTDAPDGKRERSDRSDPRAGGGKKSFHMDFKHDQKLGWAAFEQHDVLFLAGPAGTGKTHLAVAFAVNEVLAGRKKRIIIARPIVEAGERLGFLPGTFEDKVNPYLLPIFDCISRLVGYDGPQREKINRCMEIAPLAYLRGRTFYDSVMILDEAQNASYTQLKLFLSRFADNTKVIVTGDPNQSDLPQPHCHALGQVMDKLEKTEGIGIVKFSNAGIVRHPLVGRILERLEG